MAETEAARYRWFGGKRYELSGIYSKKSSAQATAVLIKKNSGFRHVRVVSLGRGKGYAVYFGR